MPAHTGPYLQPARRCFAPRVAFGVVIDTYDDYTRSSSDTLYQSWRSAAGCVSYRRRSGWSRPLYARIGTPDALWEWMTERALTRTLNWVIAPIVSDVFTLARWWDYANSRGILWNPGGDRPRGRRAARPAPGPVVLSAWAASARCDSITYTDGPHRWRWVSARDWWPDLGVVGGADRETDGSPGGALPADTPRRRGTLGARARALVSRLTDLSEWWRTVATAPLGVTPGASAVGILRSHVGRRALCQHTDDTAHRLERRASHGGRSSLWFRGAVGAGGAVRAQRDDLPGGVSVRQIPGPLYHVDVRSLYPWLLRERVYPVRLYSVRTDLTPDDLLALAHTYAVIAHVRVRAAEGEYPLRRNDRTIYPIGEFTTYLTTPDLLALSLTGRILQCYCAALYYTGKPFSGAVNAMLSARALADSSGNATHAGLCKLIANSLAGKLAQRAGRWQRLPALDGSIEWGEIRSLHAQTGNVTRYQFRLGLCWRWDEDEFPAGPYTAAFAHLCAYGRAHMRSIRSTLPPRSVLAQDTDGLWLRESGYEALRGSGALDQTGPGTLRLTDSARSAEFLGPAHYCIDGVWTLAGYHDPEVDPDARTVTHSHRYPLFAARHQETPRYVIVRREYSPLPTLAAGGRVCEDGWIEPPHLVADVTDERAGDSVLLR